MTNLLLADDGRQRDSLPLLALQPRMSQSRPRELDLAAVSIDPIT